MKINIAFNKSLFLGFTQFLHIWSYFELFGFSEWTLWKSGSYGDNHPAVLKKRSLWFVFKSVYNKIKVLNLLMGECCCRL